MKTLKLPILLIINLLLSVWPPKQMSSCGFYISGEEWRFWTFDPNLKSDPGLQELFYSMDYFHKGFSNTYEYYEPEISVATDEFTANTGQWLAYIHRVEPNALVSESAISDVLYETGPVEYFQLKEGLLKENAFMQFAHRHAAIEQYLDFAKKCENYSSQATDSWYCTDGPTFIAPGKIEPADRNNYYIGEPDYPFDSINSPSVFEEGEDLLSQTTDPFLKERFAFQLVRVGYYQGNPEMVKQYYLSYLQKLPDTYWLKNSACMYYALHFEGAERNYALSQIFDVCPDKRFRCIQLIENGGWQETIKLAKNNHERANIRIMNCLQQPGEQLQNLEEICRLDPNNKLIPALWIREINKLEDWILGASYAAFGSTRNDYWEVSRISVEKQKALDMQYGARVLQTMQSFMKSGVLPNQSFYHLCSGYIAFMLKDLKQASLSYAKVNFNELDELGKTQYKLCSLMLHLSLTKHVDAALENEVADCILYLKQTLGGFPQRREMLSSLLNFVGREFLARQQRSKGLMLFGFSGKPYQDHPLLGVGNVYTQIYALATPKDIDGIFEVLDKKNPSRLEQFLRGKIFSYTYDYGYEDNFENWDRNKLLDLKSMKLIQEDRLNEAYNTLVKIDTAYWNNEVYSRFKPDDPFCVNAWNGHLSCNFKNRVYTKPSIIGELLSLKKLAANSNGETKARALLKIANAYYSMSYHGKYWIMQKNYQGGESEEYKDDVTPGYYSAARAKYYYKQILNVSKDPKLLGAALYYLQVAFENSDNEKVMNKALLRRNAEAMNFYEQLSGNCDLFYEFIQTYN